MDTIEKVKPLVEITQEAFRILYKELGIGDTLRFVNQFTSGRRASSHRNYTDERRRLFANQTLDDILNEIKQARQGISE